MRNRLLMLLFVFVVCSPSSVLAQHKVRIVLKEETVIAHDSIYVTGSFNNWDSTPDPRYRLQPLQGREKAILLSVPSGPLEYKFHRGSWPTVEKSYNGWEVNNRVVTIARDTILKDSVAAWRDEILQDKWLALGKPMPDTVSIRLLISLVTVYSQGSNEYYNPDSALFYSTRSLLQLQTFKENKEIGQGKVNPYVNYILDAQEASAGLLQGLGNYTNSLALRLDNLKIARAQHDTAVLLFALEGVATSYANMKDYRNELAYAAELWSVAQAGQQSNSSYTAYAEGATARYKAEAFYYLQNQDSALYYARRMTELSSKVNFKQGMAYGNLLLGFIYTAKGRLADAKAFYFEALNYAQQSFLTPTLVRAQAGLAKVYQRLGQTDSAFVYAKAAFAGLQQKANIQTWGVNTEAIIAEVSPLLADLYQQNGQPDSAYKYLQLSVAIKDSLYNLDKLRQFQNISFNETLRQQQQKEQVIAARRRYENRIKFMLLIGGLLTLLVVALLLYRNNRQKQKANLLLQKTNAAVEEQRAKAEEALKGLRAAQAQLIQSEKMASLGELTAGIAHEIQNPLNFVNNFSEANTELLAELKLEAQAGHTNEVIALTEDLEQNQQKITHHGKRADSIVKGMLQHTRASTGEKQPTDINRLVDEYLRLSYQGMRAKDKSFQATVETHFDDNLGKIAVVPQEIGRVLLNLFNNAFYAVGQKKAQFNGTYSPVVEVNTKQEGNHITVTVKDNGIGIPEEIKNKVFQPFFTTKPTGEGTGLGLSLSYDIVTKGHGGTLSVQSIEGEGSEFVVKLPAL